MRALVLLGLLLPVLAMGQRSCSSSSNSTVTGTLAAPPVTAASAGKCCELCGELSNCVAATIDANSFCTRYSVVASKTVAAGVTLLRPLGPTNAPPNPPRQRWSLQTTHTLQWHWAGIQGGFVSRDGCKRWSLSTGAPINNTCGPSTQYSGWSASYTLNDTYVISNLGGTVAAVVPTPGWFINLEDGSVIISQPVFFDALDGRPPIGVALMNVNGGAILTAFNVLNGKVVWRATHEEILNSNYNYRVAKSGNTVLVSGLYVSFRLPYLAAYDSFTGVQLFNTSWNSLQGAATMGGRIASNTRYAATGTSSASASSTPTFSLLVVNVTTGAVQCQSSKAVFWYQACDVVADSMDDDGEFLLWCSETVTTRLYKFSAATCAVNAVITMEEIFGTTVTVEYDVKTRSVVATQPINNQVVAYSRDSGRQLWGYSTSSDVALTVAVGSGVAIVSANTEPSYLVALELAP